MNLRRIAIVGGVKVMTVYRATNAARQRFVVLEYRRPPTKNDVGDEIDVAPWIGQLTPGQAERLANLLEKAAGK